MRNTTWRRLPTEAINPKTKALDRLSLDALVATMARDSRGAVAAVERARPAIARGVRLVASAIASGGRLIFAGAGTSGRLGVIEAAELPPTFGLSPRRARAVMAGGAGAVGRAREGVEDDRAAGARAIRALGPAPRDVIIGISASGVTPFVIGAVAEGRRAGVPIIAVTCHRGTGLRPFADVVIVLDTGAEVIAGSTRLKAGTATKIALNILTSAAMVRTGRTYGNLMVDVRINSAKLRDRAIRILSLATGLSHRDAGRLLERNGGSVKAAIQQARVVPRRAPAV